MKREETLQLPEVIKAAEKYLIDIFSDKFTLHDARIQENAYIAAVTKIVQDAGIKTRPYFDKVPAIKKARKEAEKNQSS